MSFDADRLWELLPAVYRVRDETEGGGALRALMEVLARQSVALEETLAQLYDDQFVETAAPWVLPYLGDLLGIEGLPPAPLASRAEVANTLAWRRRKGTAHVLERIARDVTGLDARAVEFFELLAATQHLNHPRPANRSWVSVRGAARLEDLNGPFERLEGETDLTHTVDVRRIGSGRGRYNIPNVGIFLWRLRAYRQSASPAVPVDPGAEALAAGAEKHCFRFDPLGCDAPLFHDPVTEDDPVGLAGPLNVPIRISRRRLRARLRDHYGETLPSGDVQARSVFVERSLAAGGYQGVQPAEVEVCDLTTWRMPPAGKTVSVDPVLGRLSFLAAQPAPPRVTFHRGFAGDLGGGEYGRGHPQDPGGPVVRVRRDGAGGAHPTVQAGLAALLAAVNADPAGRRRGVLEIADGGRYEEAAIPPVEVGDRQITLRARDGHRPTLVLQAPLELRGGRDGAVTLDGLLVVGRPVVVSDSLAGGEGLGRLHVRHCTLVPGRSLRWDRVPQSPGATSLEVGASGTEVRVERSVVGPVQAAMDARVRFTDSVVDATRGDLVAYSGPGGTWGAPLRVESCTVVGRVRADALELASNTLFLADPGAGGERPVETRRTQEGCVRFSYLPPGSRTPRRFQCQPRQAEDDARVRPTPLSTRYGEPAYALLPARAPDAVRRGADDEGEMGALHLFHLSRREAHLRARLEEYLRFGLEAGVFFIP